MANQSINDNNTTNAPISPPSLSRRMTHAVVTPPPQPLQRRSTSSTMAVAGQHVMELEYEEWDPTSTPFYQHCVAGSLAGVAEHLLMYPFDTIKTYLQTTKASATSPSMTTLLRHHLQSTQAFSKLWRGAQAMAMGCIPAHAGYFSSYEVVKACFLEKDSKTLGPVGSTFAGATAALSHDLIMVPADTIKQRLQLGYYAGVLNAFQHMYKMEGLTGLYRALPVTLCTNLPYGAVMVTTNEALRGWLQPIDKEAPLTIQTTLLAGSGAGMAAAAVTAPLDRCKTVLQTQGLALIANEKAQLAPAKTLQQYKGMVDAATSVVRTEGYVGLFRGVIPRVVTHTPSVAISWTVYEVMKVWLLS